MINVTEHKDNKQLTAKGTLDDARVHTKYRIVVSIDKRSVELGELAFNGPHVGPLRHFLVFVSKYAGSADATEVVRPSILGPIVGPFKTPPTDWTPNRAMESTSLALSTYRGAMTENGGNGRISVCLCHRSGGPTNVDFLRRKDFKGESSKHDACFAFHGRASTISWAPKLRTDFTAPQEGDWMTIDAPIRPAPLREAMDDVCYLQSIKKKINRDEVRMKPRWMQTFYVAKGKSSVTLTGGKILGVSFHRPPPKLIEAAKKEELR